MIQTIDYTGGISISQTDGVNELTTLDILSQGLSALAIQVVLLEKPVQNYEQSIQKKIRFFGFNFDKTPQDMELVLPCFFHWYGTSVCNYARLVGFLSGIALGVYDIRCNGECQQLQADQRSL